MATATASRGRLARAQEVRETRRRDKEYNDTLVNKYYAEQRCIDAAATSALKDDFKRRDREARERQAEQGIVDSLYRAEKERELAQLRAHEEGQLATAVQSQFAEEQRERGELADLHSKHDVLRNLSLKLKTAQMSRERHLQLQEREMIETREKEYAAAYAERLEADRLHALRAESAKQWERRMDNFRARDKLEEQMQERVEAQAAARSEHEAERDMVDAVMAAIDEEDRLQGELRRRKQAETIQYINSFIADREDRRERQRHSEYEEERKIQEHLQEVKRREEAQQAALAAKREEADRIYCRLKAEKEAAMAAQQQEEFLIDLLHQEENEARLRARAEERHAYEERMKQEMVAANHKQLQMKAAREAAAAAEDERFKQQMLAKFAEDDRLEQLNAQKRRMKMQEHRREVERLVAEKRDMFEEARREQSEWETAQRAKEEREMGLVERERCRLLREAADLIEYLPKGVLRNRADLDYVLGLAQELKTKGRLD